MFNVAVSTIKHAPILHKNTITTTDLADIVKLSKCSGPIIGDRGAILQ